jgi:hypothetical protein
MGLGPVFDSSLDGGGSMMVGSDGMIRPSVIEQLYSEDLADISIISGGLSGGLIVPGRMPAASFPGRIVAPPRFLAPRELNSQAPRHFHPRGRQVEPDCERRRGSGRCRPPAEERPIEQSSGFP